MLRFIHHFPLAADGLLVHKKGERWDSPDPHNLKTVLCWISPLFPSEGEGTSPGIPLICSNNITTQKHNCCEESLTPGPFPTHIRDLLWKSPRPFQRHVRTLDAPISPSPWDLSPLPAETRNENPICPFFQHPGPCLSLAQSGHSSVAGEPTGPA